MGYGLKMANLTKMRCNKKDLSMIDSFRGSLSRPKTFSFMTQSLPKILEIKVIPPKQKRKKKLRVTFLQEFEL